MSQIQRAVETANECEKPVHDEETGQGFKQRSGMIFLNHKSDLFMTMLRIHGDGEEIGDRPEKAVASALRVNIFEMYIGELTELD